MAKDWYPVVDYITCMECGTCVSQCPHGVFDKEKVPSPIVINPTKCIDHCHACGNKCPVGAITYVGDDTGWTPPNGENIEEGGGCCCGGSDNVIEAYTKTVFIEYLYLDLKTCDRCIGTDQILKEIMLILTPALQLAGYTIQMKEVEIASEELAKQYHFFASPTIRVNGRDVFKAVQENSCDCCGEISGTDTSCRIYEYEGQMYEVPPKVMLAQAILKAVYGEYSSDGDCSEYTLPNNLKNFFDGKAVKRGGCGGNCC